MCDCPECIGYQPESEEEQAVMDEHIRRLTRWDIIVWRADGTWSYRKDLEAEQLEDVALHETVPYDTARWWELKGAEAKAQVLVVGGVA